MSAKHSAQRGTTAGRIVSEKKEGSRSLAEEVRFAFNNSQQQKPQKQQEEVAPAQSRKRGLGRGLSALLTSTVVSVTPPELQESAAPAPKVEQPVAVTPIIEAAPATVVAASEAPNEVLSQSISPLLLKNEEHQNTEPDHAEVVSTLENGALRYVAISSLSPNPEQPRQYFNEEELISLASSIKESGLLQPILVREDSKRAGQFEIIAGERRWRAATRAGLEVVPVLLKSLSDKEALQIGIIENVQRANLNPIEEAEAYQRLIDDFGQTQAEVAETIGKDRTSVANGLRLLKLGRVVRDMIISGELTAGHGRALLMVEGEERQVALARRIQKEGLSVRAAEQLANEPQDGVVIEATTRSKGPVSPTTMALEDRLRRGLGTKVKVTMKSKQKGDIKISFFSTEELESLLERLAV